MAINQHNKSLANPFWAQMAASKILARYYRLKKKLTYTFRQYHLIRASKLIDNQQKITHCLENLDRISKSDPLTYEQHFAKDLLETLKIADYHLHNKFNLLGSGWIELTGLNWHKDYKSGFVWPKGRYYRDYKWINPEHQADVKFPWELSRGHQYLKLGQAYLLTGDEKYSRKFMNDIASWIDENPWMQSINWSCTMEVAIRAVNWTFALSMFKNLALIDSLFLKKIFTSLYLHGLFIYRNPEKNIHNNHNHYISDLAGQIFLGLLFKGTGESDAWLENGKYELFREIRYQILPTGVDYERSINYHRLVLELISYTLIALKNNQHEIPPDISYRVEKMFDFVQHYLKPDGTAPVIGDQDDGRFLPFGNCRNIEHRYILSVGAVFARRKDLIRHSAGFNEECFFLFGSDSSHHFAEPQIDIPELSSEGFKDAGFFIMRKSKNYMFVNLSGKGRYSELDSGTHTHSDLLSFELYSGDKSFIVDPGTYLYSANPKERLRFRATAMHNTVVVDGNNQNRLRENILWGFERDAIPTLINWTSTEHEDVFEGMHNGYSRLEEPVIHRRKIIFNKSDKSWLISDHLEGTGTHLFEWYFHFDENILLSFENDASVITKSPGTNLRLVFENFHEFKTEILDDYISKEYGRKTTAKVLKISKSSPCPLSLNLKITNSYETTL